MTLYYHTSVGLVKEGKLQMRVRFVCIAIIFFGVLVLITGCGKEDITEPEAEMTEPKEEVDEPEDPCLQKGPPNAALPFNITPGPGGMISSSQEFTLDFRMVVVEVTDFGAGDASFQC